MPFSLGQSYIGDQHEFTYVQNSIKVLLEELNPGCFFLFLCVTVTAGEQEPISLILNPDVCILRILDLVEVLMQHKLHREAT